MTVLTTKFVNHWSALYRKGMGPLEARLLTEVDPGIAERGYLTVDDLVDIGRWKANRVTGRLRSNTSNDIREVTAAAFKVSANLRHRILSVLAGVRVPMASAILTVSDPQSFTVTDYRSLEALERLGEPPPRADDYYPPYRRHCLDLSDWLRVSLRDLDRSLWKWHQYGMPEWPDG